MMGNIAYVQQLRYEVLFVAMNWNYNVTEEEHHTSSVIKDQRLLIL
jgi:hypothetical protein